jgi:hypothetical protein
MKLNIDGDPTTGKSAAALENSKANQEAAAQAKLNAELQPYAQQTIADLNSGNYSGAWNEALQSSPLYNTNYSSQTTDPLLADMESAQGLQELDPSIQWNATNTAAYYNALGQNPVYSGQTVKGANGGTESLGQNPYGDWGAGAAVTNGTDAKANLTQDPNSSPNVSQFAGARPRASFLDKYGADIAAIVATVATAGAGAPALGAALAGSAASDLVNGAEGKLTLSGALEGAGMAALGAAVPGASSALNSATGNALGTVGSNALVGAGVGALGSKLTGGNPLVGAIGGGAGGAIQASGINNTVGQQINSATGLPVSVGAGLSGGALGAGVGAITGSLSGQGAANGALMGGVGGALRAGVGSATGNQTIGNVAGTIGSALAGKYLTSSPAAATAAAAPATATVAAAKTPTPAATTAAQTAPAPTPLFQQPTNIGTYNFNSTGLGYQPMSQVNPGITNYATYGQGPEANFFAPTPGTT